MVCGKSPRKSRGGISMGIKGASTWSVVGTKPRVRITPRPGFYWVLLGFYWVFIGFPVVGNEPRVQTTPSVSDTRQSNRILFVLKRTYIVQSRSINSCRSESLFDETSRKARSFFLWSQPKWRPTWADKIPSNGRKKPEGGNLHKYLHIQFDLRGTGELRRWLRSKAKSASLRRMALQKKRKRKSKKRTFIAEIKFQ